jgi:hypothetical protein
LVVVVSVMVLAPSPAGDCMVTRGLDLECGGRAIAWGLSSCVYEDSSLRLGMTVDGLGGAVAWG